MKDKDPLDEMLEYVGSLLQVIEKQKLQEGDLPPDITTQMEQLKNLMEILNQASAQAVQQSGKSPVEIDRIARQPPEHFDQKTKQFLNRAKKLKEQIHNMRVDFSEQAQKTPPPTSTPGSKEQTPSKSNKKKMTKHLGHKGWKKL